MSNENPSEFSATEIYDLENESEYEPERRFLLQSARELGNKVLDIACGTGIVSNWLAERGVKVTGVDLSEDMLASAKGKNYADRCRYHLMDMRALQLSETFPLAYLTGNSFMFLLTLDDQRRFLTGVHDHLDENGVLVFDTRPARQSLQTLREEDFSMVSETSLNKNISMKVYYKTQYNPMTQIIKYDTKREYYSHNRLENEIYGEVDLKLTFPVEMEHLLKSCGFIIEDIFSSFNRDPVDLEGGKLVYVCRKVSLVPSQVEFSAR
ncbi:class I SAM-dependent DNA methyltransferase [Pseudobacteriovorax antillogorgiicola]|uniref:Methyltransferase domain-containing protein n=1 Tax=Pseudobacteriovorax antillogorgiicola TaxID=1513793 RepID=A0A1Y6CRY6_9BACT|nr:class I SAM-dependent methyltransferase [Pseudobacteriovorax antillogorgiicola]TCS40845.1 methyltransferase family protein [Pseudobacteriovorax antillogorgiicola]SMF84309.1 Methyltransferase domain-containing protein [Pseudobacteriovorax antillogorgiicola]